MKATIRFTKFGSYDSVREEAIVRVAEITHCVPLRNGLSLIMLTNGNSITAADSIDELENKIDEAEAGDTAPNA